MNQVFAQMFAQESVMDIQRQAFQEWYIANHHDGDIHPNQQLLEWSEKGGFYFASSVEDLWEAWQAAKAQAAIEIDDLKAQLKAAHESRAEFVEYCNVSESSTQ